MRESWFPADTVFVLPDNPDCPPAKGSIFQVPPPEHRFLPAIFHDPGTSIWNVSRMVVPTETLNRFRKQQPSRYCAAWMGLP